MKTIEEIKQLAAAVSDKGNVLSHAVKAFTDALDGYDSDIYKDIMFPVVIGNEDMVGKEPYIQEGELYVKLYDMWREHSETIRAGASREIASVVAEAIANTIESWDVKEREKLEKEKRADWVTRQIEASEKRNKK